MARGKYIVPELFFRVTRLNPQAGQYCAGRLMG